jgi:hypothetical protein
MRPAQCPLRGLHLLWTVVVKLWDLGSCQMLECAISSFGALDEECLPSLLCTVFLRIDHFRLKQLSD